MDRILASAGCQGPSWPRHTEWLVPVRSEDLCGRSPLHDARLPHGNLPANLKTSIYFSKYRPNLRSFVSWLHNQAKRVQHALGVFWAKRKGVTRKSFERASFLNRNSLHTSDLCLSARILMMANWLINPPRYNPGFSLAVLYMHSSFSYLHVNAHTYMHLPCCFQVPPCTIKTTVDVPHQHLPAPSLEDQTLTFFPPRFIKKNQH